MSAGERWSTKRYREGSGYLVQAPHHNRGSSRLSRGHVQVFNWQDKPRICGSPCRACGLPGTPQSLGRHPGRDFQPCGTRRRDPTLMARLMGGEGKDDR
jgi:hypothetical protein